MSIGRPLVLRKFALLAAVPALIGALPCAVKAEQYEAVAAKVSSDYVRAKNPDGSVQEETYAFGKGGYWSGPLADTTIDRLDFLDVAHTLALPLAAQHYVPAKDPKTTRLLIMVYWGTTVAPEGASDSPIYQNLQQASEALNRVWPASQQHDTYGNSLPPPPQAVGQAEALTTAIAAVQAENRQRDLADRRNAMMLGYDSWWNATFDAQNGTALEVRKQDMLNELEEDRYFVVLMAYDFQLLEKEKKHKLLWETRFSIRERNNQFDKQLASMASEASKFFGKDSRGLNHDPLPEGRVELGEIRDLGTVSGK